MTRLNSTGSFWQDNNGDYWSYSTQLTGSYKGYNVYNATYYSNTTSHHQSRIPLSNKGGLVLHYCSYGSLDYEHEIKNEIDVLKDILKEREQQKRNTAKKKRDILALNSRINELSNILAA
jgi:hypothetical protein